MKKIKVNKFVAIVGGPLFCCAMTACTSLQSQMGSYDDEMKSQMKSGHWNQASKVIDTARFECTQGEESEVADWRSREYLQLKVTFAKSLQEKVDRVRAYYEKGDLAGGDKERLALKEAYFGGQSGEGEPVRLLPKFLRKDEGGSETGIPESLVPCADLAWVEMLSDRNLARMTMGYSGFLKRLNGLDVNGGKKTIKELDSIAQGYAKVGKWHDKIDLFMEMLADKETRRWTPIDRSTYALSVKKMEALRDEVAKTYKVTRWNTRVIDRKRDYAEVVKLSAATNYYAAMQILSSHDLLIKPDDLKGAMEFDDAAERAKVASGDLGEQIVRQLFETGLNGVQYSRRTKNGVASILVIGRTTVEGDKSNKRKLREAGRVAQMQARSEFVRYLGTSVSASSEAMSSEIDDESHQGFSSMQKEKAEAEGV